jgi:hypothetical protein
MSSLLIVVQQCVPAMTLVPVTATVFQQCPTSCVGCLVPRKNATDMDGPIESSSHTLECEEHLITASDSELSIAVDNDTYH